MMNGVQKSCSHGTTEISKVKHDEFNSMLDKQIFNEID